jgi:pimeloyl-ACP methyl ester carboxylesterase
VRVFRPHLPDVSGSTDGLAWNLFLPQSGEPPRGGVLILHGAGSTKESHHDYARACASGGLAALAVDLRGHGESEGVLGAGAIDDVVALAGTLRREAGVDALGLRGSSMGGYLALVAAARCGARAVVAICPAPAALLRAGVVAQRFEFRADDDALIELLDANDDRDAIAALDVPVMLLHARGDESVPVEHSRELAAAAAHVRLVEIPGGHHRSIQHDAELQGETVRWLSRRLRSALAARRRRRRDVAHECRDGLRRGIDRVADAIAQRRHGVRGAVVHRAGAVGDRRAAVLDRAGDLAAGLIGHLGDAAPRRGLGRDDAPTRRGRGRRGSSGAAARAAADI